MFFFWCVFIWGHDRRVSAVIDIYGLRTDCVQCREWKCGSVADRRHSRLGSVPLSIVACIRGPSRSRGVGVLWSVAWTVSVVSTPCWREGGGGEGSGDERGSQPASRTTLRCGCDSATASLRFEGGQLFLPSMWQPPTLGSTAYHSHSLWLPVAATQHGPCANIYLCHCQSACPLSPGSSTSVFDPGPRVCCGRSPRPETSGGAGWGAAGEVTRSVFWSCHSCRGSALGPHKPSLLTYHMVARRSSSRRLSARPPRLCAAVRWSQAAAFASCCPGVPVPRFLTARLV